jgi:hypothetical protein
MKKTILFLAIAIGFLQVSYSQITQSAKFKSRFGLVGGGGSGFKYIPVVELTDGSKASISFGGGLFVQFSYGVQFSRHFDLTINAGGQFSKLDKNVSNASMNFDRSRLSVTPSFVVPIQGGDIMNLKIGAGLDWIYGARLTFDLSKLPDGVKDVWKYDKTLGEHVSVIFEYKQGKRLAFSGGLVYNNASYKFVSGTSSYPSSGADMEKPNGSSVDVIFGAYYTFNWVK